MYGDHIWKKTHNTPTAAGIPAVTITMAGCEMNAQDKATMVMQTYTNHVDRSLTEAELPDRGNGLNLRLWQFKSKTLDKNLIINTTGLAYIVPDDLANMFQGCIDGLNTFDPWE